MNQPERIDRFLFKKHVVSDPDAIMFSWLTKMVYCLIDKKSTKNPLFWINSTKKEKKHKHQVHNYCIPSHPMITINRKKSSNLAPRFYLRKAKFCIETVLFSKNVMTMAVTHVIWSKLAYNCWISSVDIASWCQWSK